MTNLFKTFYVGETCFHVHCDQARSEYRILQRRGDTGTSTEVITVPNLALALEALEVCEYAVENPDSADVAKQWAALVKRIDAVPLLTHAEASARRHVECQQKLLNSLRSEPLVQFGSASFTRSSIVSFFVARQKETIAVMAELTSGALRICWTGGSSMASDANRRVIEYTRLANQQYVDSDLAKQFDVRTPAVKAPEEPLVPPAQREAGVVASARANNLAGEEEEEEENDDDVEDVDEDADVDDKPPTRPVPKPAPNNNGLLKVVAVDEAPPSLVGTSPKAPKVEEETAVSNGIHLRVVPPLDAPLHSNNDQAEDGALHDEELLKEKFVIMK